MSAQVEHVDGDALVADVTPLMGVTAARARAAGPFVWMGLAGIIAGGLVAAAVAHAPAQTLVWMSAYLVLIVGVAQIVFGLGAARLSARVPASGLVAAQWFALNFGNAGVIGGTLLGSFAVVAAGEILFTTAIALFLFGTPGGAHNRWRVAYRILLALIFLSSLVGLVLSAIANLR